MIVHVLRKPLVGTVAANALQHGCGALNIDECRVVTSDNLNGGAYAENGSERHDGSENWRYKRDAGISFKQPAGRWPANLVLKHLPECLNVGSKTVKSNGHSPRARSKGGISTSGHAGQNNLQEISLKNETVSDWACHEDCPILALDRQSGVTTSTGGAGEKSRGALGKLAYGKYALDRNPANAGGLGDSGGASRFFQQVAIK